MRLSKFPGPVIDEPRMLIRAAHSAFGRIFFQRCFYLFALLLAFIAAVPFIEGARFGPMSLNVVSAFLVVATVAAVGRTLLSFVIALLLAGPALAFEWMGLLSANKESLAMSWWFAGGLYASAVFYLLRYVFQRDVMTTDKLFGAAAAYLMMGVLWAYLYALIDHHYPGSFASPGRSAEITFYDLVYFSFTVLTSTGFGDFTPLGRQARGVCIVEQVAGSLFVAILIARLVGVYPRSARAAEDDTHSA